MNRAINALITIRVIIIDPDMFGHLDKGDEKKMSNEKKCQPHTS